jgi:hypothetical protein
MSTETEKLIIEYTPFATALICGVFVLFKKWHLAVYFGLMFFYYLFLLAKLTFLKP